jgi:hypothetical protein
MMVQKGQIGRQERRNAGDRILSFLFGCGHAALCLA